MTTHPIEGATMSRRTFLRRTGLYAGAVAVTGTALLGYRAYDQGVLEVGDGPAYAAWDDWDDGPGLMPLVGAATLAPSPHNSQAWLFDVQRRHIDVFADHARSIGAIDPFGRELHVGVGAAIENLVLEAGRRGLSSDVELAPLGGRSRHAARVVLTPGRAAEGSLARWIPHRHTNRYAFVADRAVPVAALAEMQALRSSTVPDVTLQWIDGRRARAELGDLLVEATEAIVDDDAQSESDFRWLRQSWDDIQRHRDGITIDTAGLSDLTGALAKLLPAQSRTAAGESWIRSTRDRHVATAAAYGMVLARDVGDVRQQLDGGRLLQRVHLWATAHDLALHHMNQVTERVDRERQLGITPVFTRAAAELVGPGSGEWLAAFRIGHPTRGSRRSPRRSVEQVVAP